MVETQLLNLAKRGRLAGLHLLLAGYNVELRRFNQQLAQHIAQTGAAAALQPDLDNDGDLLGGVRLRRFSQGDPPPGRGYIAFRQRLRLFQAATPQASRRPGRGGRPSRRRGSRGGAAEGERRSGGPNGAPSRLPSAAPPGARPASRASRASRSRRAISARTVLAPLRISAGDGYQAISQGVDLFDVCLGLRLERGRPPRRATYISFAAFP